METEPALRSISWEAPRHHHVEKGNDWFFALAIVVVALIIAAIIIDNTLLALLFGLAGGVLSIAAAKRPPIVPFSVSVRGVKVEDQIYPFSVLESYHIDEDDPRGPQLYLQQNKKLMPLLVLPIPAEHVDDIEDILQPRLKEEELDEPMAMKLMELFGV
jgi:hypothetical protein